MGVSKKQQKAVERISEILGEESVVLIGAHALSAWGVSRATIDIDFAASVGPKEIASRLAESGVWAKVHRGGPDDTIPWSVRGVIDGVPFDILPPLEGLRPGRNLCRISWVQDPCVPDQGSGETQVLRGRPQRHSGRRRSCHGEARNSCLSSRTD